ncbi:hypothetical protein K501DRAFT_265891 [Backusella circina FSU 941]|nr:hypothetical protein K501DRAFT_265891 [Backusella circina FSU 941]
MLWRIINESDILCHISPGYSNPTVGHCMETINFFNYSHVVYAHPTVHTHSLKCYSSSYQLNLKMNIVAGNYGRQYDDETRISWDPIRVIITSSFITPKVLSAHVFTILCHVQIP